MDLPEYPTLYIDGDTAKGKYLGPFLSLGYELDKFLGQGGSLDAGLETTVGYLLIQVPQDSPMYQVLAHFCAECLAGLIKVESHTAEGLGEWLNVRISEAYMSQGVGGRA